MRKKGKSREMRNRPGKMTDDRFGGAEGAPANRAFNFHDRVRSPTRRQSGREERETKDIDMTLSIWRSSVDIY